MSQQQHELPTQKEARIQLAIQAIERDATLSLRRAATTYNVSLSTLSDRRAGKPFRRDCPSNSMRLTMSEEQAIVQHILDLDLRGPGLLLLKIWPILC